MSSGDGCVMVANFTFAEGPTVCSVAQSLSNSWRLHGL